MAVGVLQCLDVVRKEEAVPLVPEPLGGVLPLLLPQQAVEAVLSKVAEGCVTNVMT